MGLSNDAFSRFGTWKERGRMLQLIVFASSGRWDTWRGVISAVDNFDQVISFQDQASRRLITLEILKGATFRLGEHSVEAICHWEVRLLFEELPIC